MLTITSQSVPKKVRLAHVGYTGTENDADHMNQVSDWLYANRQNLFDEVVRSSERDVIDLGNKPSRDFLSEEEAYDIVILHHLYSPDPSVWPHLRGFEGGFAMSPHHSVEAWRKRLASSGADMIFAFGGDTEVSAKFLGDMPGFALLEQRGDMAVYERL